MKITFVSDLNWVKTNWHEIYEVLKPAVMRRPRELSRDQLLAEITRGKLDLWQITEDDDTVKAYGVSVCMQYVEGLAVYVRYLAGEGLEGLIGEIWPKWCAFLKSNGVKFVTIGGRPGWARAMKKQLGEPVAVILMTEL